MEESRLIRKFSGFSPAARRELISKAFNISKTKADELINKIIAELKREEEMLHYVHSKKEIDENLGQEIDRLKMQPFGKRKRAESTKHRSIRLHLSEIKQLRDSNATWKDIEKYLRKNYKIKASWVWIKHVFLKNE